jgi:hypothetical protein
VTRKLLRAGGGALFLFTGLWLPPCARRSDWSQANASDVDMILLLLL